MEEVAEMEAGEPVPCEAWRPRVLVVAAEGPERRWLRALFRALGAECDEANDGVEALFALDRGAGRDLILADVDAAPCGGRELAEVLSRCGGGKEAAVVLFGDAGDARGLEAALSGAVSGWVDRGRLRLAWTARIFSGLLGIRDF